MLLSALAQLSFCLIVWNFHIPNPNILLFVVLSAVLVKYGYAAGIVSGLIAFLYSAFFFSTDHSFFLYTSLNLQKLIVIGLGIAANILLIGRLQWQFERSSMEKMQAEAEEKLQETTESYRAKLYHDVLTGTYNRRYYEDIASRIVGPAGIALMDVDDFKICNDTYGRVRMFQALTLKRPDGIPIPSERTVYRVMEKIGLSHRPKRNPKGITKADREARKSDDLLKRNFTSEKPLEKCVTDITEIKAKDGKLYVSAIFDCFDSAVLGLAMETTMKATLCQHTVENAFIAYPEIQGAVLHSDRGSQYTSELYRSTLRKYEIIQSMNSAGGRCHDNARCESMWARLKTELLYDRYNSENLTVSELKSLIWRYFISYWNNRRICTTNGGLPPMLKRQRYYDSLRIAA